MLNRFSYLILCLGMFISLNLCLFAAQAHAENASSLGKNAFLENTEEDFLSPDKAFQLSMEVANGETIVAQYTISPGYYLYKNRLKFAIKNSQQGEISGIDLPQADIKEDPNFGKMEVYHHDFAANIHVAKAKGEILLDATYQGCSEKGLCYAPQHKTFTLKLSGINNSAVGADVNQNDDVTTRALKSGNLLTIISVFFVAGLLLSLTPCVLPMIPILSSIIVGSHAKQIQAGQWHSFGLSVAYVLGMALSYAAAGVVAGMTGNLISQSLQNPWVLGLTALLFVALAMSMFGFYELKLPTAIEDRMLALSQRQKGGQLAGVFAMGVISALIVSPCVAAPLAFALVYIGQTHNLLLGGLGLFALALGMGVPLLLVGASAGKLLPKPGKWMNLVKYAFGVMMLSVAAYVAWPILPKAFTEPIGHVFGQDSATSLGFKHIKNASELDATVANSRGKVVMLDFYADWCTSCKEMEKLTFSDPQVRSVMQNMVLLELDVTNQTADDVALQKRFKIIGPPGVIFFNRSGQEIESLKVVGYQNAEKFLEILNQANTHS